MAILAALSVVGIALWVAWKILECAPEVWEGMEKEWGVIEKGLRSIASDMKKAAVLLAAWSWGKTLDASDALVRTAISKT